MLAFRKAKTAPTPYPRLPFHGIRIGQFLAGIVVSAMMSYFIWNLVHEDFEPPRTFWTMLAASLVTLLGILATTAVYVLFGLSPLVNLCFNGLLLALWAPSFAFLWYWTTKTLSHYCNFKSWTDETGIMVCRIYKALFAFALFGLITTLAAVLLDIYVFRRTVSRGKYKQMGDDGEKPRGISAPFTAPQYSDSRDSISLANYTTPETIREGGEGYAVPEEQFNYDTSYHGGHEPDGREPHAK